MAMQRAGRRGQPDRIETAQGGFFTRARECYLALAAGDPGRFAVVDAGQEIGAVRAEVEAIINRLLDKTLN
jgi:dTMP kinase